MYFWYSRIHVKMYFHAGHMIYVYLKCILRVWYICVSEVIINAEKYFHDISSIDIKWVFVGIKWSMVKVVVNI